MQQTTVTNLQPRRSGSLKIPTDPVEAASAVLAIVKGEEAGTIEKAAAIAAMSDRVQALMGQDRQQMLLELAGHAAILDSLFQRFAVEGVQAGSYEVKARYAKLALHCQAAYARTLGTIESLRYASRSKTPVPVTVDHGEAGED